VLKTLPIEEVKKLAASTHGVQTPSEPSEGASVQTLSDAPVVLPAKASAAPAPKDQAAPRQDFYKRAANIVSTDPWYVDRGEYRQTYIQTVERAQHELPKHLLEKISVPEAYALHASFREQTAPRVLIVGQETYGNYLNIRGRSPFDAWENQVREAIAFDYAYGLGVERTSRFWLAFEEIRNVFGLPTRRALAWSNLLKVQLIAPINDSMSTTNLPAEDRNHILRWQRALFRKELQFIKPGAILFLTGSKHWIAPQMFDPGRYREYELAPGATIVEITEPNYKIPMVQTYHPGARMDLQFLREARLKAVDYLMTSLPQRV
jgi:hypothetical protein